MSDRAFFPHTRDENGLHCLCCNHCGKYVSTLFVPIATDTPDRGLIVRALIQCPECLERFADGAKAVPTEDVVTEEPVE